MMRKAIIAITLLAAPASAQEGAAQAALAASQRLENASVMLENAGSSRDRVAALTETIQAYEDGLVAMREGLRSAAIRQQALELELNAKREEVAQLLGVLQTMERSPGPLLLLHPSGPTGTARSGMIISEVTPAIQSEVDHLKAQFEEVTLLRQLQDGASATLQKGLDGAQSARAELSAAISDRVDLPMRYIEDPVQTALIIASAETLDAFATSLVASEGTEASTDALAKRGELALPVQGRILRRYNEEDLAGVSRPGLLISARPRALVTTPIAATLRFKGELLDYGNVVVLEPAADVLFIITGLIESFGTVGEVLPAGAPLGLMGGVAEAVDDILSDTGEGMAVKATETLYLEVREGQSPVDPATWFAVE